MEDAWVLRFLITVWRMRKHQIAWFRLHKQSDLIYAKQYENDVDIELMKRLIIVGGEPTAVNYDHEGSKQGNLFE